MASLWITIPMAALAAALLTFLFLRLQLHRIAGGGRAAYIGGAVLIVLVASWNAITSISDYQSWFIITAYPILSNVSYVVLAFGAGLVAVALALYADRQRSDKETVELRESRLGLLKALQSETRVSYQLLELLSLALREILLPTPERAGVTFLINRGKRQMVLGATANLTKNEIAYLEHYSLDGSIVAQALELGDPMIAGAFALNDAKGAPVQSRFQSSLVLPLISGNEPIGAIVLLAEDVRSFGRTDLLVLAPVADWVAEKIRAARLTRELSLAKAEVEQSTVRQNNLLDRLVSSAQSLSGTANLTEFCRQLVGLAGSTEAYVCGLSGGSIQIYGGTESLADLTEQYRLTLIDSLERGKPIIINHESGDHGGPSTIVRSSLLFPLTDNATDALLLRKDGSAFTVSDYELKLLSFFGLLAKFILQYRETSRRDLSRRLGFEKVIQLIQPDVDAGERRAGQFMRHFAEIVPPHSQMVTLVRQGDGAFAPADAFQVDLTALVDLRIEPGEGLVGESVAQSSPRFAFGKLAVLAAFESLSPTTQQIFHAALGERRLPHLLALAPLQGERSVDELVMIFFHEVQENDRLEWERLITLAVGLYSLRCSVSAAAARSARLEFSPQESERIAPLVNQLNNHLSAVIGSADLAASREEVSGELRALLKSIVFEAESASKVVKRSLVLHSDNPAPPEERMVGNVNRVIEALVDEIHISGDLYMAGGRPRALDVKLGASVDTHFEDKDIRQLFEAVLNRFAAISSDEDVISIATYVVDQYLYLDISRHRRNFPPVQAVASFGDYVLAEHALQHRPSEVYLKPISQGHCYFASDMTGPTPAYLSFKFPLKAAGLPANGARSERQIRVLAIDDQAVILDLIAAMCQSLGYYVQTARSGSDGLKLASTGKFDIILTDLAMPDVNGLQVARQIRALQPATPIILVTGWEAGLDQAQIEAAGITEVLLKPFRIEQLTDLIRSVAARIA